MPKLCPGRDTHPSTSGPPAQDGHLSRTSQAAIASTRTCNPPTVAVPIFARHIALAALLLHAPKACSPAVVNHPPWHAPRRTLFGAGSDQGTAQDPSQSSRGTVRTLADWRKITTKASSTRGHKLSLSGTLFKVHRYHSLLSARVKRSMDRDSAKITFFPTDTV